MPLLRLAVSPKQRNPHWLRALPLLSVVRISEGVIRRVHLFPTVATPGVAHAEVVQPRAPTRLLTNAPMPIQLKRMPIMTRHEVNKQRFYKVDGFDVLFPSVTTVLGIVGKPGIQAWEKKIFLSTVKEALLSELGASDRLSRGPAAQRADVLERLLSTADLAPNVERDSASGFGTHAHLLFDDMIKGRAPAVAEEYQRVVGSFEQFVKQSGLSFHGDLSELMVYSPTHRYAGALDAMAWRADPTTGARTFVALDWKTSKATRPEYALQLAAYAKAFEETQNVKVSEGWVVRFDKQRGTFEVKRVASLDTMFAIFLSALKLWRFHNSSPSIWLDESKAPS